MDLGGPKPSVENDNGKKWDFEKSTSIKSFDGSGKYGSREKEDENGNVKRLNTVLK